MAARHLFAGALTAPLLLLAACGGGDDSVADPPVSPSPPSPSASTPQHESPEAFIRRWADADIAMQNSGHSWVFRRMSRRCKDCIALADRVDAIYNAGGYIRTNGWSIQKLEIVSAKHGRLLVNLRVRSFPTTYRESAQGPKKGYPGGEALYQVGVEKIAEAWSVVSLGRLAS
jgi:hypothetical protein